MNKFIVVVCLLAIGCKANVSEPNSAANAPKDPPKETAAAEGPSFSQCAESAGHFVWNKTKGAYDYVTSEEAKKAYSETWDKTKQVAGEAYDSAMKSYKDWQAESAKDEKKEDKSSETP